MSIRICTLTMNKIFIWASNVTREVATAHNPWSSIQKSVHFLPFYKRLGFLLFLLGIYRLDCVLEIRNPFHAHQAMLIWGTYNDHLMNIRNFTLTMNKICIWALKVTRKVATADNPGSSIQKSLHFLPFTKKLRFLFFLLGIYRKPIFYCLFEFLHVTLPFGNFLSFYISLRYVSEVLYSKLRLFVFIIFYKRKLVLCFWEVEFVWK